VLKQLDTVDNLRRELSPRIAQKRKSEFGQFMTPLSVAQFMAGMFPQSGMQDCCLLDAGAGIGALSCAFIDRWVSGGFTFNKVKVTAYEVDNTLCDHLIKHLNSYDRVESHIVAGDYIEIATAGGLRIKNYTHVILNPPYKKITSQSAHRLALQSVGIEMVNLYSAFVALAIAESAPGGQIVAIIPRSFCNGPYYRPFREFLLKNTSIEHIHLFGRRDKAFSDDAVLQENIIIRLVRDGRQGVVKISQSTDNSFVDLREQTFSFSEVVQFNDSEKFIHIPDGSPDPLAYLSKVRHTLADIGISVSTGPVVDFRMRAHLRKMPEVSTVPLIYPVHLNGTVTTWPKEDIKKWNAISLNFETQRWLFPGGNYVLLRRFSSKEEKRRINVSLLQHADIGYSEWIGFENHINVFHINRQGLPEYLALGLYCWLHSTALDQHLRRFSGHTQINATDLRNVFYPEWDDLIKLGEKARLLRINQTTIDQLINQVLS